MAWSVLQSNGASNDTFGGAGPNVAYLSNLSAGTKLIAVVTGGSVVSSVKDGALNSFTKIISLGLNGNTANGESSVWAMDTPAGDVGTKPTITATEAPSGSIVIQEVSGLAPGNTLAAMIDGTASTNSGSFNANGSVACGAYSSAAAGEYLLAVEADSQNSTPSGSTTANPTGSTTYTKDAHAQTANFIWDAVPAYGNSTGGAETASFGITGVNSATSWATFLVAFKLDSGAPPIRAKANPGLARKMNRKFTHDRIPKRATFPNQQPVPDLTAGNLNPWQQTVSGRRGPGAAESTRATYT